MSLGPVEGALLFQLRFINPEIVQLRQSGRARRPQLPDPFKGDAEADCVACRRIGPVGALLQGELADRSREVRRPPLRGKRPDFHLHPLRLPHDLPEGVAKEPFEQVSLHGQFRRDSESRRFDDLRACLGGGEDLPREDVLIVTEPSIDDPAAGLCRLDRHVVRKEPVVGGGLIRRDPGDSRPRQQFVGQDDGLPDKRSLAVHLGADENVASRAAVERPFLVVPDHPPLPASTARGRPGAHLNVEGFGVVRRLADAHLDRGDRGRTLLEGKKHPREGHARGGLSIDPLEGGRARRSAGGPEIDERRKCGRLDAAGKRLAGDANRQVQGIVRGDLLGADLRAHLRRR